MTGRVKMKVFHQLHGCLANVSVEKRQNLEPCQEDQYPLGSLEEGDDPQSPRTVAIVTIPIFLRNVQLFSSPPYGVRYIEPENGG
jgi:hypothetical protein